VTGGRRPPPTRARRSERGAVAIEAALVTGVVFAMIFGILEMAFLMRDYVGVTSASRVGARAASTSAAAGACVAEPGDVVACPPNGVPELAQMAADAIGSAHTVLPKDQIDYIMVYKANEQGYPGAATSMPPLSACTSFCVAYRWSPSQNRFRYAQGSWDSRQINACAKPQPPSNLPLESVGLQIVVKHDFLTGIFGSSMDLSDHAVMKFEPLSNLTCAAGKHQ
jgi:Flp pilus assembly protein TadG